MPIKRVYYFTKRKLIAKKFKSFGHSSVVGKRGFGEGCIISGASNISIGEETFIGEGSELLAIPNHFEQELNPELVIGNRVRATKRLRVTCKGKIVIEDDVLIAPDVFITDHNHGMDPTAETGYSRQQLDVRNVKIEKGVWLGQRTIVLPGVVVGAHSIIGANSTVTKSIPPYCIAVGSPARVVKTWNFETSQWISKKES